MRHADSAPYPPLELANRVDGVIGADGDYAPYEQLGRWLRAQVLDALPADWHLEGKQVLDFGCGAGRTLRHFLPEAEMGTAEFWGSDIDIDSIAWLTEHLCPPLHAIVNAEAPPLALPDNHFDLIYAISVFTHITSEWSAWLLEMHRLLKDDGLLLASFLGEGMSQQIAGEPWREDRIGMNVLASGQRWDRGGPNVLLSPWWIRAHWGRAFDIVTIDVGSSTGAQGVVVLRKRSNVRLNRDDLERLAPGEPREPLALRHSVDQLLRETASLRETLRASQEQIDRERQSRLRAEGVGESLAGALALIRSSRSWRTTEPLRSLRRRLPL